MKKFAYAVLTVMVFGLAVFAAPAAASYAAPIGGSVEAVVDEPTLNQVGQLEAKIEEITEQLTTVGRPLAVLALVLVFISYVAEPVLPDWARENKGMMRKVLFAALGLGVIPDLVGFAFGS
ncbi:hypothetical protein [Herpetosiphon geysericola]|uniref:Uncharacterized protein n=1 Tax=Herpetosiphon geysericola TaxID=70996 RepID=A0A0P6YDC9_9CHLR|nr:hypothetical protein [Herpetosiphon geysericola]KPL83019.1 hypothetical protein SE18_19440 [Herpetosiphon geysericola]